jgi:hypothetical protein
VLIGSGPDRKSRSPNIPASNEVATLFVHQNSGSSMKNNLRQYLWLLVLLLVGATGANAQTVTGRVVASDNLAPLQGALVTVADGPGTTLTNADGRFSIAAPGTATLVVRLLGYAEQRVAIDNRAVVNVALQPSAVALDELVVVGYGQQTRATVSGSVSSINAEDIARTSAPTAAEALVGKIQ